MAAFVDEHGQQHSSGRLSWGPLKEFADGALGSATALMHEPYTHQPHTSGLATMDFAELAQLVGNASEACLQVTCLALLERSGDTMLLTALQAQWQDAGLVKLLAAVLALAFVDQAHQSSTLRCMEVIAYKDPSC